MKRQRIDPPRLTEDGASELGRLLHLAGKRTMDATTTTRLAQRLEARGAFAAAASSPPLGARLLLARLGPARIAAVALVAIGGALVTWHTESSELYGPAPAREPSASAPTHVAGDTIQPAPTPEPSSVPVEALPSTATTATPVATVASSVAARSTAPRAANAATPSAEFALIRRAQVTLASDPAGALAIVEEHARAFPAGELVQERELSAVEALARLGRKAEATARARALVARFPRTPYVARLERALGEPL